MQGGAWIALALFLSWTSTGVSPVCVVLRLVVCLVLVGLVREGVVVGSFVVLVAGIVCVGAIISVTGCVVG